MPEPQILYDLSDSTDLQLKLIKNVGGSRPSLEDWAKPEMVAVLLERHEVTLTDLKQAKTDAGRLDTKIKSIEKLNGSLSVDLARAQERQNIYWLEIPLGALIGFAINMLTQEKPQPLAWFLLAIALLMLLFIRAYPVLIPWLSAKIDPTKSNGE